MPHVSDQTTLQVKASVSQSPPGYDVILLVGQSNMVGFSGQAASPTLDPAVQLVSQLKQDNSIVMATEFLDHPSTPTGIGPGFPFARAFIKEGLNRGRKVLLVPSAVFATPLVSTTAPTWNATTVGSLADAAIARANTAIAAEPGSRLAAILWIQGGADGTAGATQAQYASALDALIAKFRANITGASTVPFILSADPPETNPGTMTQIRAALADTPNRNTRTAYVSPPTNMSVAGLVHYSNAGERQMGQKLFDGYQSVRSGIFVDTTISGTSFPPAPDGMHLSNRFYIINSTASTNLAPTINEARHHPWPLYRTLNVGGLFFQIAVAGSADSVVRLGIYADDGTGLPGALIMDFGTLPGNVTGVFTLAPPSALTLNPGLYWVAAVAQGTTAPTLVHVTAGALVSPQMLFAGAAAFAPAFCGWRQAGVSGALPATFSNSGAAINTVRTGYKVL